MIKKHQSLVVFAQTLKRGALMTLLVLLSVTVNAQKRPVRISFPELVYNFYTDSPYCEPKILEDFAKVINEDCKCSFEFVKGDLMLMIKNDLSLPLVFKASIADFIVMENKKPKSSGNVSRCNCLGL